MPPAVLAAVGSLSAVLGLFFNGYILLVLVYNKQIRTANNLMLLHLGFVDSIFCVQLLVTVGLQNGILRSGPSLCAAQGFTWTALLPVIVWSLTGLNCDRYCAISTPLHYSRLVHTKRVFGFLSLTWFFGIALACPPLFSINPYVYRDARGGCTADFTDAASGIWYGILYASIALFLPTAIMIFCNVRIFLIARFHRHRIVSAIYEITLRAQATITHQRNPFYLTKYKGRCAILTILQLIGSLVLLYFPYFGVILSETVRKQPHGDIFVTVATALVTCSPPTHGFVYGVKSRVLRKTFKNFLRRQLYQSEVHSEIQRQVSRRASLQMQQRRSPSDTVPRRYLQRRMSEILNVSPKPNTHRRLSEFTAPPPDFLSHTDTASPPHNGSTLEWLAKSLRDQRQETNNSTSSKRQSRSRLSLLTKGRDGSPITLIRTTTPADSVDQLNAADHVSLNEQESTRSARKADSLSVPKIFSHGSNSSMSSSGRGCSPELLSGSRHSIMTNGNGKQTNGTPRLMFRNNSCVRFSLDTSLTEEVGQEIPV